MVKQILILIILGLVACASPKIAMDGPDAEAVVDSDEQDFVLVEIKPDEETDADSTEYELIVLDTGFETWYTLRNNPSKYRSHEYYKNWNARYISDWNYKVSVMPHARLFNERIEYNFTEDYPFEIDHKLFYYFMFVENELRIPILSGMRGPKTF